MSNSPKKSHWNPTWETNYPPYSSQESYSKFKAALEELVLQSCLETCTLPIGFKKPMILSASEEKVIRRSLEKMLKKIDAKDFKLAPNFKLVKIEYTAGEQKDLPFPLMKLTIGYPKGFKPVSGFYLSGIFQKERAMREIVKAKINYIVYTLENGNEVTLLEL